MADQVVYRSQVRIERVKGPLRLRPDQRPAAARAYRVHADHCPGYRTIHGCIDITTSLDLAEITSVG